MFKIIDSFLKPNILDIEKINDKYFKIILEPMEKGFGHTIGNSMRRILLSSIPGCKITEVEIENTLHEFDIKNGIKEDILELLINIKGISILLNNDIDFYFIELNKSGIGKVTTNNIKKNINFNIINNDHYLCYITNEETNLNIKMKVQRGIGYLFNNNNYNNKIGKIYLDTCFSPIEKVSYKIENTRLNNRIDLEKLIIDVETNGTISPIDSIKIAANLLISQVNIFLDFKLENSNINNINNDNNNNIVNPIFFKTIDSLNLTVRSLNCLKFNNIKYIGDLIQKKESSLLKLPNFGKKSLFEIKNILLNLNLSLNTTIDNWNVILNKYLENISK